MCGKVQNWDAAKKNYGYAVAQMFENFSITSLVQHKWCRKSKHTIIHGFSISCHSSCTRVLNLIAHNFQSKKKMRVEKFKIEMVWNFAMDMLSHTRLKIFPAQVLFDTNDAECKNIWSQACKHWMTTLIFGTDWCTTFQTINFCVWKTSTVRCCAILLWVCCCADV